MSILYAAAQYQKTLNNPVKHEQWQHVLQNMVSGAVTIGSRTPVTGYPAWATPEVAPGGFATGRMVAGSDLVPHEREMIQELSGRGFMDNASESTPQQRQALQNFLTRTEDGLQALAYRLHSKSYRIGVPEEGCLMVYAWLCERRQSSAAAQLLADVEPFFDRLRFHPKPLIVPDDYSRVSISTVDALLAYVDNKRFASRAREQMRQCEVGKIRVLFWNQIMNLWLSTLNDATTRPIGHDIQDEQTGKKCFRIARESGWPCQSYPASWATQATAVVAFYLKHEVTLSANPIYVKAIDHVCRAIEDRNSLTGRDVGYIRLWLAGCNAKHGLPGDSRYEEWLHTVLQSLDTAIRLPSREEYYQELGMLIQNQVNEDPNNQSLSREAVDAIIDTMVAKFPAFKLLKTLRRRLSTVMAMTFDELYASNLVSSPDMMAIPLFTFASDALAAQVLDESAQYLYKQLYHSFLRRRSLLLLNFSSQTKIAELPWVAALDHELAASNLMSQDRSKVNQFVRKTVGLSMSQYGETPLRDPFVRVLEMLLKATETNCILLKELAADIFEGGFVGKFVLAYEHAKTLLTGTCYDRYYNICEALDDSEDGFFRLCAARAERNHTSNLYKSFVACNGMVIEQGQILTTHNMAMLFDAYKLAEDLTDWNVPTVIHRGLQLILKKLSDVHNIKAQTTKHVTGSVGPLLRDVGGLWRQLVFWFAILEKYDPASYVQTIDEVEAAALPNDTRGGCQLETYQTYFRELINVLRDPDARSPTHVVLGWSA